MCVVDDQDNVLPPGEVGEICAKGPNVMLGYWNKPEVTAETLRNGWLHTGDMGYIDEDGYVYVVDRKKDMIVSGGENVYSSEVEAVLYRHEHVAECAVVGVPDDQWGEAVHAVIVKSDGAPPDTDFKRDVLLLAREHLAAYKVPKEILVVDELPKSPTGKIQKFALKERFWEGRDRRVGASLTGAAE
jgi:acyl-CoA synthetase (AMP-forming)/AMP-acid ligase II